MKYLSLIPVLLVLVASSAVFPHAANAADALIAPMPQKLLCTDLTHDMSYGATDATSGGDVTALQVFLNAKGYMTASPVGAFGPLTRAAVIKFQSDHSLPAYGYVGPMTRPVMKQETHCGSATGTVSVSSVSPSSAAVGTKVTLHGSGFNADSQVLLAKGAIHASEVTSDGTILTFTLPDSMGVYCPPGSMCIMIAMLVQPGTYDLSVRNTDGASSNSIPFTVVDSNSKSPIISGLDAPVRLSLGQTGTWTLHAAVSDSNDNEVLHYSVVWGDQVNTTDSSIRSPDGPFPTQTSATFTHSYARSGNYTPVFTVSDNSGNSATASASITVDPLY